MSTGEIRVRCDRLGDGQPVVLVELQEEGSSLYEVALDVHGVTHLVMALIEGAAEVERALSSN